MALRKTFFCPRLVRDLSSFVSFCHHNVFVLPWLFPWLILKSQNIYQHFHSPLFSIINLIHVSFIFLPRRGFRGESSYHRRLGELRHPIPSLLGTSNPYLRVPGRLPRPFNQLSRSPEEGELVRGAESENISELITRLEVIEGRDRNTENSAQRFDSIPEGSCVYRCHSED